MWLVAETSMAFKYLLIEFKGMESNGLTFYGLSLKTLYSTL
jgi:hypothetical protein